VRRTSCQGFALTSTISLDLLQATKIDEPSVEGWAHVGWHEVSPGFGGSMPWPPLSFTDPFIPGIELIASAAFFLGAPIMPISLALVTMKCRATFKVRVTISTSRSSIMQAEYCFVPCGFRREPCGIVHVCMRATSVIVGVETT